MFDVSASVNNRLNTVMREAEWLRPLRPDDSDAQPGPDPSASMSYSEFMDDLRSSKTWAAMDHAYEPPPFSCNAPAMQRMKREPQWSLMMIYAGLKAMTLPPDPSLDAKADYLRAILDCIRDAALLPPDYTGELALSRILTALAYNRVFRDRVHRMMVYTGSSVAFPDLFYDVAAYITYNHADPPCYRSASRRRPRRRIAAPEDVPLPPRSPSPPAEETAGPPPYKTRLHRPSIEGPDTPQALRVVGFWALQASLAHAEDPDPVAHHVTVVQAILKAVRESQRPVATPYFEDMSDADLRAVVERDAAFAAVLDELKRTAANLKQDKTDDKLLNVVGRVVNHLCQPRKRTRATTRSVRFAPF